jgi:nicotinate-nucleotide--dimethylbenzimidazole phosphoribosyltransferase
MARERQQELTKPPGSLGRLEGLAIQLASLQGDPKPTVDPAAVVVFAGDHGVVTEGVSAFPQAVTVEMIRNFARGGAAISVLARQAGAALQVVNCGTATAHEALDGVIVVDAGPGTANFCQQPAMTQAQLEQCLDAGRDAVRSAAAARRRIFIGGEMGIGNTTAAAAVAAAVLETDPAPIVGPGTGLDEAGVGHKTKIVRCGLARHAAALTGPLDAVRCLGGFEIAALVGAYLAAPGNRLPVLVDGFISTVAALVAVRIQPQLRPWLLFAHRSAEPGHDRVLEALGAEPLLDLSMRLGEGSGAGVALGLLRSACALHNGMATFAEAGISAGE